MGNSRQRRRVQHWALFGVAASMTIAACGSSSSSTSPGTSIGGATTAGPTTIIGTTAETAGGTVGSTLTTTGASAAATTAGSTAGVPTTVDATSLADETKVLRIIGTNTPQNLDPIVGISRCDPSQIAPLYDQLVRVTPDGQFVPGTADSWSSPDPLTFKITLHPGIKFSDGTPYDAAAVKSGIDRARTDKLSTLKNSSAFITSVDSPDATTVLLHLSAPRAGVLPALLADRLGEIPSPTAVAAANGNYGANGGVGAGPYRYVSNTPNDSLVLTRWDGYWQPSTQLMAGINFMGPASQFQTDRINSGEVDYAAIKDTDYKLVDAASKADNIPYKLTPSDQYAHIFINISRKPFDDIRVRQALEFAVDRELLTQTLTDGAGTPAYGPIQPTSWGADPAVKDLYPYDPAKAKQLLADAGYPNGITLKMAEIDNPYYQRMASAVQDMLKDSGITVEYTIVTGAEIQNALYLRKDYDAAITAWIGNPDPGITMEQRWATTGSNNPSGVATPGLDDLLAKGAASVDQNVRATAYKAAEMAIMKNASEVPLFFNSGLVAFNAKVKNVVKGYTTCATGNFLTPPVYFAKG